MRRTGAAVPGVAAAVSGPLPGLRLGARGGHEGRRRPEHRGREVARERPLDALGRQGDAGSGRLRGAPAPRPLTCASRIHGILGWVAPQAARDSGVRDDPDLGRDRGRPHNPVGSRQSPVGELYGGVGDDLIWGGRGDDLLPGTLLPVSFLTKPFLIAYSIALRAGFWRPGVGSETRSRRRIGAGRCIPPPTSTPTDHLCATALEEKRRTIEEKVFLSGARAEAGRQEDRARHG